MKKATLMIVLCGLVGVNSPVYAVSSNDVNQNLSELNSQINELNKDLTDKQKQKQKLDAALKDSQGAIAKSEKLLQQLRQKRDMDVTQLQQLSVEIDKLTAGANQSKGYVNQSINRIYQQIQRIRNSSQSIFNGNDSLDEQRKQTYLLQILAVEQQKYQELAEQLGTLQALNDKLEAEVDRLDDQLGETRQTHQKLLAVKNQKLVQASTVQHQILKEKNQLSNLRQRQAQLNRLLTQLAQAEQRQKAQQLAAARAAAKKAANTQTAAGTSPAATTASSNSGTVAIGKADTSVEDNSPFMSRKLVKPINGKVIVGFGQMRDSVRNNGVLLSVTDNTPVYALSGGNVLFSGELPGFGQIIVIDHGDNYTSVYSGILSRVNRGAHIAAGTKIAVSGTSANQPMEGVYFELRHLGKPVNPSKLFN